MHADEIGLDNGLLALHFEFDHFRTARMSSTSRVTEAIDVLVNNAGICIKMILEEGA